MSNYKCLLCLDMILREPAGGITQGEYNSVMELSRHIHKFHPADAAVVAVSMMFSNLQEAEKPAAIYALLGVEEK